MAQLLWPNAAQPETSLRTALYFLRDQGPLFATDEPLQTHVPCDATQLLETRGLNALHAYSGAFLENVDLGGVSSEFEEWVSEQRERLARHVQVETLNAAERLDPVQAAALAEQAFRLAGSSPATMGVLRRMLALSLPGSAFEAELRADMASFVKEDQARSPANQRGRMLGRHIELDTLLGWAMQEGGGIASISGPGGIGKSTLGRELLRELSRLGRAVLYVDAEGVRHTSELMARMVAAAGSARQAPDTWAGVGRLLGEQVVVLLDGTDALEDLPKLLLEAKRALPQVRWVLSGRRARLGLPAWRSDGAPWRGAISQPDLGEVLSLRLAGLEVPAPDTDWAELTDSSAVQLLLREGGRFRRDLKLNAATAPLLGSLARRLQGHPLALALAASWLRVEDLALVYARVLAQASTLEDADPALNSAGAKRGLALVAARSWELLGQAEQVALLRLSLCPDFEPQDAAALGVSEHELDALLEHSFLETFLPGSERQRICPALSSVAQTYGPHHPELLAAAKKQHAEHYLNWFTALSPTAPKTVPERENLRLALHTALAGGWATSAALYHLMSHYDNLAMPATGTDIFQELCDTAEAHAAPDDVRAAAQIACMWLAQRADRLSEAQVMAEQFLESQLIKDPYNKMKALNTLAVVYKRQGDFHSAAKLTETIIELSKEAKDYARQAMYTVNLLEYLIRMGLLDRASEIAEGIEEIAYRHGSLNMRSNLLWCKLELVSPDYMKIIKEGECLLAEIKESNHTLDEISIHSYIASAYLELGYIDECSSELRVALELSKISESRNSLALLRLTEASVLYRLGKVTEARSKAQSSLRLSIEQDNVSNIIDGLLIIASDIMSEFPEEASAVLGSIVDDSRANARQVGKAKELLGPVRHIAQKVSLGVASNSILALVF